MALLIPLLIVVDGVCSRRFIAYLLQRAKYILEPPKLKFGRLYNLGTVNYE